MAAPVILIVNDEPLVRGVAKRFLERSGYQALEAGSGGEALRVLRHQLDAIALLLTDIIMPGLSGTQLAAAARKVQPALPLVFMSGYCIAESLDGYHCLPKPFKRQELVNVVAEALTVKAKAAY